ncbi:MAG: phage protease, partial [Puniceicoccales bacterium]|nr:phage protease [Puniceicoccales bacterium]
EKILNQWIKLLPYGDYPHPKGVQRFSRLSAEMIIKNFKSLGSRLARKFLGLPIFIGHPDDNMFSASPGHGSNKIYGRIEDIEARKDGMWILIHWSDVGYQLVKNGFFRFLSPRWRMKNLVGNYFEPVKLLSVGLTNNPNIKTCRLIDQPWLKNIELSVGEKFAKFIKLLGLSELLNFEEQLNELESVIKDSTKWRTQGEDLIGKNKKLQAEAENFYHIIQANELKGDASMTKDCSLNDLDQVDKPAINNDTNGRPSAHLNTETKTVGLNNRTRYFYEKKDKILTLVRERMVATGDKYYEAWAWARRTNPSLFID